MENLAVPLFDLFGEQVVVSRRFQSRRGRKDLNEFGAVRQMGFIDLESSDEELEEIPPSDEFSDDFIDWIRGYLLKASLRQITHSQVSAANKRELLEWMLSDEIHPFSFVTCCIAAGAADYEAIRDGVLSLVRKN